MTALFVLLSIFCAALAVLYASYAIRVSHPIEKRFDAHRYAGVSMVTSIVFASVAVMFWTW